MPRIRKSKLQGENSDASGNTMSTYDHTGTTDYKLGVQYQTCKYYMNHCLKMKGLKNLKRSRLIIVLLFEVVVFCSCDKNITAHFGGDVPGYFVNVEPSGGGYSIYYLNKDSLKTGKEYVFNTENKLSHVINYKNGKKNGASIYYVYYRNKKKFAIFYIKTYRNDELINYEGYPLLR